MFHLDDDDTTRRAALRRIGWGLTASLSACAPAPAVDAMPPERVAVPSFKRFRFPLRRQKGRRHLLDADGQAFLLHGDSAWSLLVEITREDVLLYLEDRARRGVNTLLVNLLERKYATAAPRNRYGDGPFDPGDDFRRPNPSYFDHAAWVVEQAAARGQLVLLAASYIGCCGDDGWYAAMVASGKESLRAYGRFLGRRFRAFDNVMWVHGGDANPADREVVAEIALGIREVDPTKLHTGHTAPGFEAMGVYAGADWLDVNNVYTYDPVSPIAHQAYRRAPIAPFFLIESEYEGENRRAPDGRVRAQAWQAMLGGAMGQLMGNNPIWHFASPKPITPFKLTWQQAMDAEASRSMVQLRRLFETLPWWQLVPDLDGQLIAAGRCDGHYGAVAASTPDYRYVVVYCPRRRQLRLRISRAVVERLALRWRWFDPVGGAFLPADADGAAAHDTLNLVPPRRRNAGADADWVLLIEPAQP